MDIYELNKFCNQRDVDIAFEKMKYQKRISKEDAALITCYVLRDRIGILNTLKVLRGFGLEKIKKDR